MRIRAILNLRHALWGLLLTPQLAAGQNYIHYHQRALDVYTEMLDKDHGSAMQGLRDLEKRFALLPPETYALAFNACILGDTATAAQYFRKAAEQGSAHWMWLDREELKPHIDTLWFDALEGRCSAIQKEYMYWADGPIPGKPVPTTGIGNRYQFVIDSLSRIYGGYSHELNGHPEAQLTMRNILQQHDLVLDSIIAGDIPIPCVQRYGMNSEFETFLFHVSPEHLYQRRKTLRKWLKRGLIFPRTYATCYDQLARMNGELHPYGVLLGFSSSELVRGYEEQRRSIGMGDDRLDSYRFHWMR